MTTLTAPSGVAIRLDITVLRVGEAIGLYIKTCMGQGQLLTHICCAGYNVARCVKFIEEQLLG